MNVESVTITVDCRCSVIIRNKLDYKMFRFCRQHETNQEESKDALDKMLNAMLGRLTP